MRHCPRFLPSIVQLGVVMLLGFTSWAQPAIGLYAGLNSSSISGDIPSGFDYSSNFGLMGGIIAEIDVAQDVRLSLQPMYVQRGTYVAVEYTENRETDYRDSLRAEFAYLSVPLLVKISAAEGRTFFSSGLEFAYLGKATLYREDDESFEQDISSALRDIDVAVHLGFGVVFPIGTPRLTVEARYSQSLLNLSELSIETGRGSLPTRFRSSSIQLLVAVLLPLGGAR